MSAVDEHCPKSPDGIHSESWWDCEPCTFCGDDTPDPTCDCPKCTAARGGQS